IWCDLVFAGQHPRRTRGEGDHPRASRGRKTRNCDSCKRKMNFCTPLKFFQEATKYCLLSPGPLVMTDGTKHKSSCNLSRAGYASCFLLAEATRGTSLRGISFMRSVRTFLLLRLMLQSCK